MAIMVYLWRNQGLPWHRRRLPSFGLSHIP